MERMLNQLHNELKNKLKNKREIINNIKINDNSKQMRPTELLPSCQSPTLSKQTHQGDRNEGEALL